MSDAKYNDTLNMYLCPSCHKGLIKQCLIVKSYERLVGYTCSHRCEYYFTLSGKNITKDVVDTEPYYEDIDRYDSEDSDDLFYSNHEWKVRHGYARD